MASSILWCPTWDMSLNFHILYHQSCVISVRFFSVPLTIHDFIHQLVFYLPNFVVKQELQIYAQLEEHLAQYHQHLTFDVSVSKIHSFIQSFIQCITMFVCRTFEQICPRLYSPAHRADIFIYSVIHLKTFYPHADLQTCSREASICIVIGQQ